MQQEMNLIYLVVNELMLLDNEICGFWNQTRKNMASGLQNTGLQWVVLYFCWTKETLWTFIASTGFPVFRQILKDVYQYVTGKCM